MQKIEKKKRKKRQGTWNLQEVPEKYLKNKAKQETATQRKKYEAEEGDKQRKDKRKRKTQQTYIHMKNLRKKKSNYTNKKDNTKEES